MVSFPMIKPLEQAIQKVRQLPEDKQRLAAAVLEEIAQPGEEPYVLSDKEMAVLAPALERALNRDVASDAAVDALWKKCGL